MMLAVILWCLAWGVPPAHAQDAAGRKAAQKPAIHLIRHAGERWIEVTPLAVRLGIPVSEGESAISLRLLEGTLTLREGQRKVSSVERAEFLLQQAPTVINGKLCIHLDDVRLVFPVTLRRDPLDGKLKVRRTQVRPLSVSQTISTQSVLAGSWAMPEVAYPDGLEQDGFDEGWVYPSEIELSGNLDSRLLFVPKEPGRMTATYASGKGQMLNVPVKFSGRVDSSNGREELRDAYLLIGSRSLRVRVGDAYPRLLRFRYQTETRRGLTVGTFDGRHAGELRIFPATFNVSPGSTRPARDVYGFTTRHHLRPLTLWTGAYQSSEKSRPRLGLSSNNRFGFVGTRYRVMRGATVLVNVAGSQRQLTGAGPQFDTATLTELDTDWAGFRNTVRYEKVGPQFVSFGDPQVYAGRERVEISPRARIHRWFQPYARWRDERVSPGLSSGLSGGRQTLAAFGMRATLDSRFTVDLSRRDERLLDRGSRRGWQLEFLGGQGAPFSYLGHAGLEVSRGPAGDRLGDEVQASLLLTFTRGERALWRFTPNMVSRRNQQARTAETTVANRMEFHYGSLNGVWNSRADVTLRVPFGNMGRSASSALDMDIGWALGLQLWGLNIQPEGKILRVKLGSSHERPEFLGIVRIRQQFSLRAFAKIFSLTGIVFEDRNRNGRYDEGEPAVAHVPILLNGEQQAMTDEAGRFAFMDLVEGVHRLRVETWELPAGLFPALGQEHVVTVSRGRTEVEIPLVRRESW